jgi:hypothetical protein
MTQREESTEIVQSNSTSDWLAGIPKAFVPSSIRAIDRLIGAFTDYPVALLERETSKVRAQTKAFELVEKSISEVAAKEATADKEVIARAIGALVRKEYRKQKNKDQVARETIALLKEIEEESEGIVDHHQNDTPSNIDDDWLNIFERYVEDASTERMQNLWARVLSGEIRSPGRYSPRTLRFLSEFSQADALSFSELVQNSLVDFVPKSLTKTNAEDDITHLIHLEAAGLINGITNGFNQRFQFSEKGFYFLNEGNFTLALQGQPNDHVSFQITALTPLGCEIVSIIPERDTKMAMRNVANAIRCPQITAAHICRIVAKEILPIEILWQNEAPTIENIE